MKTFTDAQSVDTIDRDLLGTEPRTIRSDLLPIYRLNLMRAGYLLMGVGLAVTEWPVMVHDAASLRVMDGVVILAVTPWDHVWKRYVRAAAGPWR